MRGGSLVSLTRSAPDGSFLRGAPVLSSLLGAGAGRFSVRAPVDQAQLFVPFFDYAAKLEEGDAFDRDEARAFIRRTLQESYLK